MITSRLMKSTSIALALAGTLAGTAASAQSGYYRDLPEPVMPSGYDGSYLPPAPQGYVEASNYATIRDYDRRYAYGAQTWARDNCVKSGGNVGAGIAIGAALGALTGNLLSSRGDGAGPTIAGAVVGGAAGGVIASNSSGGDTDPGCPPGYVVRRGAVSYSYSAPNYYYAAPSWYRPWYQDNGTWMYRPYPYHDWYYRTYRMRDGGYTSAPPPPPAYDRDRAYGDRSYDRGYGDRSYGDDRAANGRTGWYDRQGNFRDGGWYDRQGFFHMGN